jgi:hypothetical protein
MLVFFSDVHLTDGSTAETLNPEAFELFVDRVARLARRRRAPAVWCVLLGDGLDLIRSLRWIRDPKGPRPWDRAGPDQESLVLEILDAVLEANRRSVKILRELPEQIAHKRRISPQRVRFSYLLGNHDWLINRYPSARRRVVEALGLDEAFLDDPLPTVFPWPAVEEACERYGVLARHGDIYDFTNYDSDAGRDASSVGDAVCVELLARLPEIVAQDADFAGHPRRDEVLMRLREIDNVRPLTLVPEWIVEAGQAAGRPFDYAQGRAEAVEGRHDPKIHRAIGRGLRHAIDRFRKTRAYRRFVRRRLTPQQRFYLTRVLLSLRRQELSAVGAWSDWVLRLGRALHSFWGPGPTEYTRRALQEGPVGGRLPQFVVYGHSHMVEKVPLGLDEDGAERYYLNTGTWRRVWHRGWTSSGAAHFAAWKVMTYVVLYGEYEQAGRHAFEVWSGDLCNRGPGRMRRPPG